MLSRTRIGTICYYVTDIDRTEAFYRDVLGLEIQRMDDDGSGNVWLIASIANNVDLIFFRMECRPGNSPIIVFDLAEGGIDDVVAGLAEKGATIVAASSLEKDKREALKTGATVEAAKEIGKLIAERAVAAGIKNVVFDRGGYMYHGRVKALADGAREGGLEF